MEKKILRSLALLLGAAAICSLAAWAAFDYQWWTTPMTEPRAAVLMVLHYAAVVLGVFALLSTP